MSTTWKAENGDWVITTQETPICFKCVAPTMQLADGRVMPLRMEVRDPQNLEAVCPTCKRVMYREVS